MPVWIVGTCDCLTLRLPLASRSAWQQMGNRFSGDHAKVNVSEVTGLLLMAVGAILLIWFLDRITKWQEARSGAPNPKRLFKELCQAHRLTRADRRLLTHLAEAAEIESPADLFLRPDLFASNALPKEKGEIKRLAKQLFGVYAAADQPKVSGKQKPRQENHTAKVSSSEPPEPVVQSAT